MEKKHFGELSNLLMGIKGETIGKPGDQGSVTPPPPGKGLASYTTTGSKFAGINKCKIDNSDHHLD